MVSHLWALFLSLIGLSWVFPKTVKEALLSWKVSFVGKKKEKHVEICSTLHLLDSELNRIAFIDGIVDVQKLKHYFVHK